LQDKNSSRAIDKTQSITDIGNIYAPNGGNVPIDENYYFRQRIKGDYAKFTLVYNNIKKLNFVINYIVTIFNMNIR
jgi:hypothetical protein